MPRVHALSYSIHNAGVQFTCWKRRQYKLAVAVYGTNEVGYQSTTSIVGVIEIGPSKVGISVSRLRTSTLQAPPHFGRHCKCMGGARCFLCIVGMTVRSVFHFYNWSLGMFLYSSGRFSLDCGLDVTDISSQATESSSDPSAQASEIYQQVHCNCSVPFLSLLIDMCGPSLCVCWFDRYRHQLYFFSNNTWNFR